MFVKVCGISTPAAAAVAAEAGADAIGCVFYPPSPRNVAPIQAAEVCRALPAHVRRVAVMLHPTPEQWARVRDEFEPDVLQTDAADFPSLDVPDSVTRWPVFRESAHTGPGLTASSVFVYEGAQSGQGEAVDWERAAVLAAAGDMILAGGLDAANVAAAIRIVRPFGVDVSSGVESAPGVKDAEKIRNFIKAARAAETSA